MERGLVGGAQDGGMAAGRRHPARFSGNVAARGVKQCAVMSCFLTVFNVFFFARERVAPSLGRPRGSSSIPFTTFTMPQSAVPRGAARCHPLDASSTRRARVWAWRSREAGAAMMARKVEGGAEAAQRRPERRRHHAATMPPRRRVDAPQMKRR